MRNSSRREIALPTTKRFQAEHEGKAALVPLSFARVGAPKCLGPSRLLMEVPCFGYQVPELQNWVNLFANYVCSNHMVAALLNNHCVHIGGTIQGEHGSVHHPDASTMKGIRVRRWSQVRLRCHASSRKERQSAED